MAADTARDLHCRKEVWGPFHVLGALSWWWSASQALGLRQHQCVVCPMFLGFSFQWVQGFHIWGIEVDTDQNWLPKQTRSFHATQKVLRNQWRRFHLPKKGVRARVRLKTTSASKAQCIKMERWSSRETDDQVAGGAAAAPSSGVVVTPIAL